MTGREQNVLRTQLVLYDVKFLHAVGIRDWKEHNFIARNLDPIYIYIYEPRYILILKLQVRNNTRIA
jgi:hypothetical protein